MGRDNSQWCGNNKRCPFESKRDKLVARLMNKPSEIDICPYSYHNDMTVREELTELNEIFHLVT